MPPRPRAPRLAPALAALALLATGCGAPAPAGPDDVDLEDLDAAGLHWVAPLSDDVIEAGDPIELAVYTRNPEARAVRFAVDGVDAGTCDPVAQADEDCRDDEVWYWDAGFETPGAHTVTASFTTAAGAVVTATRTVNVVIASDADDAELLREAPVEEEDLLAEDQLIDEGTGQIAQAVTAERGFLDPARDFHRAFPGGIEWRVQGQRVLLRDGRLDGSTAAVDRCWDRYGASIRRYADTYRISRASVVAAAVAAGNCGARADWENAPVQALLRGRTCSRVARLTDATPVQRPGSTFSPTECRARMRASVDFANELLIRYAARRTMRRRHRNDPPRLAAVLAVGAVRRSNRGHWRMRAPGNYIDRFVAAYNAYRTLERRGGLRDANNPPRVGQVPFGMNAVDPARLASDPAYAARVESTGQRYAVAGGGFWSSTEPTQGAFDFSRQEAVVAMAAARGWRVKGHTLVWDIADHWNNPAWVRDLARRARTDRDAREALLRAIEHHVRTIVGHFRGRIHAWDVVNEAIATSQPGDRGVRLNDATFGHLGLEYIERAFRAARAADPDALLIYNDFGIEGPGDKFEALLRMLRTLRGRGVPIDAVGLQSHVSAADPPATRDNIRRLGRLGVRVLISELDVRVRGLPAGTNALEAQARVYHEMTAACVASPFCDQVTVWGVHDLACTATDWRACPDWVDMTFGPDSQLLFDEQLRPKPALCAVRDALAGRPFRFEPNCM